MIKIIDPFNTTCISTTLLQQSIQQIFRNGTRIGFVMGFLVGALAMQVLFLYIVEVKNKREKEKNEVIKEAQ